MNHAPILSDKKRRFGFLLRWLMLFALGWAILVQVKSLWILVRLDVPFCDWQWYLAIIVFLCMFTSRLVLNLINSKVTLWLLGIVTLWMLFGYNGFGWELSLLPARSSPIPISFWVHGKISQMSDALLTAMQSAGGHLYLSFPAPVGDLPSAQRSDLRRLEQYDIGVYLAPPVSDFLSVPVTTAWITSVKSVANVVQHEGFVNVRGFIGDVERPRHDSLDILGLSRVKLRGATDDLANLIQYIHTSYPDYHVGVTALWTLYIDNLDGDSDLSVVQRASVDPPGNWDFINVMTYSSYIPSSWRAYYVYLIERVMARYASIAHYAPEIFPSHLIGLVGGGFPWEPVLDFDDLVRDAQISRALGVPEIVAFQLNGALKVFGDDFVSRFVESVNNVPSDWTVSVSFSRPASMILYGFIVIDVLLDVISWRIILLIGWGILSGFILSRPGVNESAVDSR